eukprot:12036650-Prorocentrum_lima.AAC.1
MEAMAPSTLSLTDADVKVAKNEGGGGGLSTAATTELPLLDVANCILELQKAATNGEGASRKDS